MTYRNETPPARTWPARWAGGMELGDRRVLRPGPLGWLRALGWMLALFVLFSFPQAFTGLWISRLYQDDAAGPLQIALLLLACLATFGLYALLVRAVEDRWPSELAVTPALWETGLGLLIGVGMISLVVGLMTASGAYTLTAPGPLSNSVNGPWGATAIGIQPGFIEELLFRAILLRLLARAFGVWVALAVSALFFGAVHLGNPNADAFAAICIAVEAGVMLAGFYVLTGRLWVSVGVHAGWNWAQGYVFGAEVSGFAENNRLWDGAPVQGAPALLSGGAFGPEASLPALVVGTLVGAVTLWWARRQKTLRTE